MLSPHLLGVASTIVLVGQSVGQPQSSLGLDHYLPSEDAVNLPESLLSTPLSMSDPYSWNGLTTFATAAPLRCLGVDAAQKYDVAILGMVNTAIDQDSLLMKILSRCTL
ncbi:hypothetical protein JB92DRAFT_3089113 [Gautieria morchelliformis]|nr:hypothetical protein JB92DRAFT_3089113 [Gautieria morchelliformis]